MKIGVLLACYNQEEYYHLSLAPWLEARKKKLGGNEFIISAVSAPFKEYREIDQTEDKTLSFAKNDLAAGLIQYLATEPRWGTEAELRNTALLPLLRENCDIVVILDSDEIYNLGEIERMFKFVENNPLVYWFRGSLKNYIFDKNHYLAEPFNPARIYRTRLNGYKLAGFRFDNEMVFHGIITRDIKDHLQLSSLTIPKNVCWARHFSWLNTENSKKKVLYQIAHFGSNNCSYLWDHNTNQLVFNKQYYLSRNMPFPEVIGEKEETWLI